MLHDGRDFSDSSGEADRATSSVLFDSQAQPLQQFRAPAGVSTWAPLSSDGELVAFIAELNQEQRAVHLADTVSGVIWRATAPISKWIRAWLVQPAESAQLWVFDGERQIDRLQLPTGALKH